MRGLRLLSALLLGACFAEPALAASKLSCQQASKCPAGVLSDIRAAADTACPCYAATSAKGYGKCVRPVVRSFAKRLGKKGFPKACRREVGRVLGNTACGRTGYVLCRKAQGRVCSVTKAKKCKDVFPTGSGFKSCSEACAGMAAVPFPSTKELSHADLASLAPDPGDGTLSFAAAPSSLDGVAPGNVIVAGTSSSTPVGLLRIVIAAQRDGQQLTLRTVPAPLQLAYAKLHVKGSNSTAIVPAAAGGTISAFSPQLDFGTSKEFSYILFDGDDDEQTTNDQLAIGGKIGGGFDYDFGIDFEWPSLGDLPDAVKNCISNFFEAIGNLEVPKCSIASLLPEAIVTFVVQPEFTVDANVHGAALIGFEKEFPLYSQSQILPPIGPLVFVAQAELKGDLKGGATGRFSTGVHGSARFESKVRVSSKNTGMPDYSPPMLISKDFGANETKVSLEAEAKVGVAASLSLLVFDTTGPYATVEPYAAITADILQAPCWRLHAGLDAALGIKVQTPDLPVLGSVTIVDWQAPPVNGFDVPIADGGCEVPPDPHDDPILPGQGPDATHIAMPTYTPWSRTYASPVDGAQAHTPGNGVMFSDLQRTIDGRYVRSGFGVYTLTKFDDAGTLTWARDFTLDGMPVLPLRVRSTTDATLFMVSEFGNSILLTKVAQGGRVDEAHSYDVPEDVCGVDITGLASDNAGGAWVLGNCGNARSFLLHASGDTATFRLIGDIDGLHLNVIETIGDDVFLAGDASEGEDRLYAFRLHPDGTVVYAKRYDGCVEAPDAIPSVAVVGSEGEVTIAGSGGAQHNGLLLRVRPDGSVGFSAFPGYGFGLGGVLILDSLLELPTTGFIAGSSGVDLLGADAAGVRSAGLVGLDAVGNIIWQKRYTFGTTDAYSASGHVAIRLADDGGVVVSTLLADALDPFGVVGRLWAFKPFIRDGSIDFLPGSVTAQDDTLVNLPCMMTDSDRPVTVDTRTIPARAVTVTSALATLAVEQQTAN